MLDPLDGGATFAGPIYSTTGTPYTAPASAENDTHEELVGAATAAFDGANRLTVAYRINDVDNVKSLERETFVAVDPTGACYGSIKDANSFAQAQNSIGTGPDGTLFEVSTTYQK